MGIAESFRQGVGAVGDIYDVRMKRAKSQAYPEELDLANKMAAAKLLYQNYENQYAPEKMGLENQFLGANVTGKNIENKYLPEKLRGENEYRGLVNKWYSPNMSSEINARDTQTKFTPLKFAIEAENATKGNSRYDDAQKFMRSLGEMPADQRKVWFADKDNYNYYLQMQEIFKSGIGNQKQNGGNILTPGFLQQFGLGGGMQPPQQGMPQNTSQPLSQGGIGSPMPQMAPQTQGNMAPEQGLAQPMSAPQEAPQQMAIPQKGQVNIPGVGMVDAPPSQGQEQQQAGQVNISDSIAPNAEPPPLTSKERTFLNTQNSANKAQVGAKMWNRAMGAVGLELFVQQNKDVFAPRIENATRYAGVMGKGQKAIDQLKKETPEAYKDYLWVTQDFIPNLSNNVRIMEGLANTNEQTDLLNDMNKSFLRWDVDPKTAVKYINMGMDMFSRQGRSILDAAQPVAPGVLERLNGIKSVEKSGNYVGKQDAREVNGQKFKFVDGEWVYA